MVALLLELRACRDFWRATKILHTFHRASVKLARLDCLSKLSNLKQQNSQLSGWQLKLKTY